jgi:outer membrane protein OmpA-like peptidoglycan-associated protein
MRILSTLVFVLALLTGTPSSAAEQGLTSTYFPNKSKVVIPMSPTERAPAVKLKVKVKHKDDLTQIKMRYRHLLPATLFGGDIVTYVVWAVSPDGSVQNLGALGSNGKSHGRRKLATPWRDFALMITAEPIKSVTSPGEQVAFFSAASASRKVTPHAFTFTEFATERGKLVKVEHESIAAMTYKRDRKHALWLIQAEKAAELLDRLKAKEANPEAYAGAKEALEVAKAKRGRKQKDASILTVELSGEAFRSLGRLVEDRKASAAKAELEAAKAKIAAAEAETSAAAGEAGSTAKALSETQKRLAQAEHDRKQLERQQEALTTQLQSALGSLATGAPTDEGFVISLSGGAFASGKTSLTSPAKYVLAKLSGMMLVFPDMTLRIEGHTDNSGKPDKNMKVSVGRAKAVETFLAENGVDKARMQSAGFGGDKPVTANDSKQGRAQNRRVEIVLVQAKDGATTPSTTTTVTPTTTTTTTTPTGKSPSK